MINLEIPKKFKPFLDQAHAVAENILRPISRQYDLAEHAYPKELDIFAALADGLNDGSSSGAVAGAAGDRGSADRQDKGNRNAGNMSTALAIMETCWGDLGLVLSIPRQGLGNSAIAAVANDEQLERFKGAWASMAITEPEAGSDSAAIRMTAVKDGDEYILNGEKIFVTAGDRCDHVVVWASLDLALGRAAIKSFVVKKGTPGMEVARLEHKLGIRSSDTATLQFTDCRVHKDNLLGSPEIDTGKGFGGVMQTFDNTRPLVAAMAVGVARAALDETRKLLKEAGVEPDDYKSIHLQSEAAASLIRMETEWSMARLLTLQAVWMADNRIPNSLQASMAKAKAGRMGTNVTLKCVELCSAVGYSEHSLLEKWSRDAKILDIFEGTQQIQLLIIARRLLEKSSKELK